MFNLSQGFSEILLQHCLGLILLPDCLWCSLQIMMECVMMPSMLMWIGTDHPPRTTPPTLYEQCVGSLTSHRIYNRGPQATATAPRTVKSNRFILAKQQLCTRVTLVLFILDYDVKVPNFTFCVEHANTKPPLSFSFPKLIQIFRIQLQKNSPTFDELNKME